MRAAYVQASLRGLARLGDANAEAVRQRMGGERLAAIAEARPNAWLAVELDACMSQSVAEVAGLSALREWSTASFTGVMDSPMLGPLANATVRLFGLSPARLIGAAPRAWDQIYRNAGTVIVEELDAPSGTERLRVRFEGLPPVIRDSQAYIAGLEGPMLAALAWCNRVGHIEAPEVGDEPFAFTVHWNESSDARVKARS